MNELTAERTDTEREPRRLRDLQGRNRRLVLAMFALLLVPFVVALARSYNDHWIPSGDEANVATRALDVFSAHPPLTGLPSTSYLYGDQIATNHPGPMEFYLLAIPLRLLGMTVGPLLTAAAINGACVLIACWLFFRRIGVAAMLWAGVILLLVMWSGGSAVLVDTLSSNMTMYSLLCTAVLAWAVIDGDRRLLPLTAFVASYAAQQHLANALLVFVLIAVMMLAIVVQAVSARRGSTIAPRGRLWPWALGALGVFAVCWTPVFIQQFTGHPGNLTAIVRFARDNTRRTLGFKDGWYQAVHAIAPNGVLAHTETIGTYFITAAGALRIVFAVVILAALVAIVVSQRRSYPTLARLAGVALVVLVAGTVNGSNVPRSFESVRVNLYRWTWTAALLTWVALGIAGGLIVRRWRESHPTMERVQHFALPALMVIAALLAITVVFTNGRDDHNRERAEFAIERRMDAAVLAKIDRHHPVLVNEIGRDATLSLAPHLIFRLVQAGVDVEVPELYAQSTYGTARRFKASEHQQTVEVVTGKARQPSGPGQLLTYGPYGPRHAPAFARLAAQRSALIARLTSEVKGKTVTFAPDTKKTIERLYPGLEGFTLGLVVDHLADDPSVAFGDPDFLNLVLHDVVRTPTIDTNTVKELLTIPPYPYRGTYGDERAEVHYLNPLDTYVCSGRPCFSPE